MSEGREVGIQDLSCNSAEQEPANPDPITRHLDPFYGLDIFGDDNASSMLPTVVTKTGCDNRDNKPPAY